MLKIDYAAPWPSPLAHWPRLDPTEHTAIPDEHVLKLATAYARFAGDYQKAYLASVLAYFTPPQLFLAVARQLGAEAALRHPKGASTLTTRELSDRGFRAPSVVYQRLRAGWFLEDAVCTPVNANPASRFPRSGDTHARLQPLDVGTF